MLIQRKHIFVIAAAALAIPAVALAASDPSPDSEAALTNARVAPPSPLHDAGDRFDRVVAALADEIREEGAERKAERAAREAREQREAFEELPGGVSIETLESIAACESGGDPTIVSADGSYRGKYQFSVSTWESVGGSGDPATAPEHEQDYRAALLYSQSGSSPWPVCG